MGPAADMIGPPMAGFIADKIGNFRLFMAALTLISGLSSLLLLLIPSKLADFPLEGESIDCCSNEFSDWMCYSSSFSFQANLQDVNSSSFVQEYEVLCSNNEMYTNVLLSNISTSVFQYNNQTDNCVKLESCSGSFEGIREDWWLVLGCYITLRAFIDVLRASSCMMFEG